MAPIPCSAEIDPLYEASKCFSLRVIVSFDQLTDKLIYKWFQSRFDLRSIRRCNYVEMEVTCQQIEMVSE